MLNFLYENYPYGTGEAFVEYEMRALAADYKEDFTVYVLRKNNTSKKRFTPQNASIYFVEGSSPKVLISAIFKMFSIRSLKEICKIIKNNYPEGILKCLYRIFRYNAIAAKFCSQYKKTRNINSNDIFVSYWLNECAFALTELKKKYPDIKIASRGHGYDVFEDRCYMPFRKEILSGLNKIFLINNTSKLYFQENYGKWFDISKTEIAHLGVDLPESIPAKDNRDTFRIVTCSAVIPLKRLDLMIDALSGIKNRKIEWVHFGDGSLFDDITEYARKKLAQSSVTYKFLGQVSLKDIHNYYASTPVHLFINCSDTEGTPVSIMEAMSYGIPAVARNVGGVNEIVDDNCGRLLPQAENASTLKAAIEEFCILDTQEYLKICKNARKKIENEFTAEKNFKEYIKNINSL